LIENNPDGTNEAQANKNEKENIPHHQNNAINAYHH
jgi:hypothetical protein